MVRRDNGFSLIEALIALIVLVVGSLGVILFQSELLRESGSLKSQQEALEIVQKWVEERRGYVTESDFSSMLNALTASSASATDQQGRLNTYSITNSAPSAVSGVSNTYEVTFSVDWPGNGDPLSVTTYFAWLDPENSLKPESASSGPIGGSYGGDIDLPTGTLTALARNEVSIVDADLVTRAAIKSQGALTVYNDSDKVKVAVELKDGTYVQLASLNSSDNELITITGRIYNNFQWDSVRNAIDASNPERLTVDDVEFANVYKDEAGNYADGVLDVLASAGANCIVTDFVTDKDVSYPIYRTNGTIQRYEEADFPSWADYLCVAGTGWNGSIQPVKRDINSSAGITDFPGLICSPEQRSYRYAIIEADDYDELERIVDGNLVGSTHTISSAMASASARIVGQSGVVRLYASAASAAGSSEGVVWSDYFWHNPDYLHNPSSTSTASLASGSSVNADGYLTPQVVSQGSPSIQYPGDVAHQNFILADTSVYADCDSALADFDSYVASKQAALGLTSEDEEYRAPNGMPGYDYLPTGVYDFTDYNTTVDNQRGNIFLGYALATYSVSGTLHIPSSESISDFNIVGNPAPIVSINCTTSLIGNSDYFGYMAYSYNCPVPRRWSGSVVGIYLGSDDKISPCLSPGFYPIPNFTSVAASSLSSLFTEEYLNSILVYYYNEYLSPLNAVSSGYYSGLTYNYFNTAITSSVSGIDIFFEKDFIVSCPSSY